MTDAKARSRRRLTRRAVLAASVAALAAPRAWGRDRVEPVRFGLTPVFLDSDIRLLAALETYLGERLGRPVLLVKRRTYREITLMLLSGQLDAAWICGFPYVQYRDQLALVAVPLYAGQPLYQSYLIVGADSPAKTVDDLRGQIHAFSDPDSNSGFLVTRHLLATMQETPANFFSSFFFTYGHRNVIRAVSAGLADSGSVDGYVWDVMKHTEADLVAGTRVVRKSEFLGFPPVSCRAAARSSPMVAAISRALLTMPQHRLGREILAALHLDGFVAGSPELFDGIAAKYLFVRAST